MPDKTLKCKDCGKDFIFSDGEQKFFAERNYTEPKRCKPCRDKAKQKRDGQPPAGGGKRSGKGGRRDDGPDYTTKCIVCGAVPVVPATGMCGPCTFGEASTAGGNW